MKTLFALAALLVSQSAFAFSPELVVKTLQSPEVAEVLADKQIESIKQGPSYRCAGCYGMLIKTHAPSYDKLDTYQLQIMDFAGRFSVNISKIEE